VDPSPLVSLPVIATWRIWLGVFPSAKVATSPHAAAAGEASSA